MRRPPGSLVRVGGHRLHVYRAGSGRPPVVFEAALAGCHAHWTGVQDRVSRSTTACSYDRAGLGWSDPGPAPRTAERIACELRELLANVGIESPRIMVGHSFGALPLRVYAAAFPSEVAGLVLLDPMEPEEWIPTTAEQRHMLDKGVTLCHRGAFAARIGVARMVAALAGIGSSPLARRVVTVMSHGGFTQRDEHILAPFTKSPPEARAALAAMWTRPKSFAALASEIESIPVSVKQVAGVTTPRHVPIAILSARDAKPARLDARDRLLAECAAGRHAIVAASSHWIQLDQPELVAETIRSIGRSS